MNAYIKGDLWYCGKCEQSYEHYCEAHECCQEEDVIINVVEDTR